MKKDLFISLAVMVLLTIIVGLTAYNLTSRWTDLPDIITKNVAKEQLLGQIASNIDRQTNRVDLYVLNPSEGLKDEIISLNKSIINSIKSLKYITNRVSSEEQRINLMETFYKENIYNLIKKIIEDKDNQVDQKVILEELKTLYVFNNQILDQINTEKTFTVPIYEQNVNQLKNYSRSVTIIITIICVMLGFILMAISVNHISSLYEKIEKQAHQLEVNLEEIKQINKELLTSNDLNIKIQEAERLRIAQDLHDEVIQGLISLIRIADDTSANYDPAIIKQRLNSVVVQIRKICQNLRPSILDDLGLYSAIEWLLDDLEKFGIVAHLEINEEELQIIPKRIELMIFRVIQELTNNIKRHSKANNVWLKMNYDPVKVVLIVEDDGCGFDYNEVNLNKTLGLLGIKERVKSVFGNLDINSQSGEGTTVSIVIPMEHHTEPEYKEVS